MNKKLLALLLVGLLAVSFVACNKTSNNPEETSKTTSETTGNYIVVGTDEQGSDVTEPVTSGSTEPEFDPSETNPTFVNVEKKVVVFTNSARIRTATVLTESNVLDFVSEGKILTVTGESENWYRISYTVNGETQTCYIAKTVAADASVLDGFTSIEAEKVVVNTTALYVRSYPSADSEQSIRGTLKEGAEVTRVATNDKWSRILFDVEVTDADGNKTTETREYYVSSAYVEVVEETTVEETTVEETTITETPAETPAA